MAVYKKQYLNEIKFPLGGIGSGSVCLTGNGQLVDWELFNKPAKHTFNGQTHFSVRAVKKDGTVAAKVLNGDYTKNLCGKEGTGAETDTMAGYSHFRNLKFIGEFPIAKLEFSDEDFPADITLTAFNPFIPLDDKNSSIPAAFFEIAFKNTTDTEIDYSAAFSVMNPFYPSENKSGNKKGVTYINLHCPNKKRGTHGFSELTVATSSENAHAQSYWYRGLWRDSVSTYWRELSSGKPFCDREYDTAGNHDGSTLSADLHLLPGEKKSVKFVLSWNTPFIDAFTGSAKTEEEKEKLYVKNYYATVWHSSLASAEYSLKRFDRFYKQTLKFKNALYSSTLDKHIIDAAGSNLEVLKSSTVFRLENGEFYGWEGAYASVGSCAGTCAHVWNYAYALCFLFPKLERTIRELDYKYNMFDDGSLSFRIQLPLGTGKGWNMPCVDGQMGGILRVYREWKISGDDEWLKNIWPSARKALEYAWNKDGFTAWDLNKDGVLEGRQHHTLDMELFGPSSWLEGMYLAALKAASEIEKHLGNKEKAEEYLDIMKKGQKWTEENLFNGKYYFQKIDLSDRSVLSKYPNPLGDPDWMYHGDIKDSYWHSEAGEIKYQIGEGCEIDQILGQWHANILGLGDIFDSENRKTALRSLYKNNFKTSMRNLNNCWRLFSVNDDSGAVICDYPEGAYKPVIPIPYCEETMHGFEYALAGLMISEGMIKEGTEIVKSVRDRYNGSNRNPFNEIECGFNYARSMASFALLPIMSGFKFDLPHGAVGFNPIVNKENFKCFWGLGNGWGTVSIKDKRTEIRVLKGSLTLNTLLLPYIGKKVSVTVDGVKTDIRQTDGRIDFDKVTVKKKIIIE